jgi:hypothetical protein
MNVPGSDESLGRFSLDHLFLDQDGIPTLVEVKRSSDTRIRREVIGQMLDYAANDVVYWPIEMIRSRFALWAIYPYSLVLSVTTQSLLARAMAAI